MRTREKWWYTSGWSGLKITSPPKLKSYKVGPFPDQFSQTIAKPFTMPILKPIFPGHSTSNLYVSTHEKTRCTLYLDSFSFCMRLLWVLQMLWPKLWKRIVLQVVERTVIMVVLDLEVRRMEQHCPPEHLFMNNNDCSQFVLPSCTVNLSLTGRALSRHMLPWWQPHKRYDENRVGTTHLYVGMFWYGRKFWYQNWRFQG